MGSFINVFMGLLLLGFIICETDISQIQGAIQIYIAELHHTQRFFVLNDLLNDRIFHLEFRDEHNLDELKSGTEIIAKGFITDQFSEFNDYIIFKVESFNIVVSTY